jgi:hypothetical protein
MFIRNRISLLDLFAFALATVMIVVASAVTLVTEVNAQDDSDDDIVPPTLSQAIPSIQTYRPGEVIGDAAEITDAPTDAPVATNSNLAGIGESANSPASESQSCDPDIATCIPPDCDPSITSCPEVPPSGGQDPHKEWIEIESWSSASESQSCDPTIAKCIPSEFESSEVASKGAAPVVHVPEPVQEQGQLADATEEAEQEGQPKPLPSGQAQGQPTDDDGSDDENGDDGDNGDSAENGENNDVD